MIKSIISDFSRVLLFLKEEDPSIKLNAFHQEMLKSGDYDFWQYFRLNQELLDYYQQLAKKLNLYIFTTEYLQEYPPVKQVIDPVFTEIFSAHRLGYQKNNPVAFQYLIKQIGLPPEHVLYIDDKKANTDAAKQSGILIYHYDNNQNLFSFLKDKV